MSSELDKYTGLLDVQSGEVLPATVSNAARVINAARAMKANVNEIVKEATRYLVAESERQGTKTLHDEHETVTVSGGPGTDYNELDLMDALREAGCPESRIGQAVKQTVSYKVDRAVLRQLAAANQDYKAAIELAEIEVDRPYTATVKLRRHADE